MSEESVPTPETEQVSVQETTPATLNLDQPVKIDGQEVNLSDVIEGYRAAGNLAEYRQHASSLMNSEGMSTEEREYSMRYLLASEGYTPSQIEEYVVASREVTNSVDMEDDVDQSQNSAPENQPAQDEAARQRIVQMEEQQNRLAVDMLKRDLETNMDSVMKANPTVQKLLEKSRSLAGEDGYSERVESIRNEIQRVTLDSMRSRRNRGEKFDKSWFDQETNKAADTVYQRIRSVIGDPDKIQRAPETASSADNFLSKPPVKDPTFEQGDNMGTSTNKAHDYTVDALSRLAADLDSGGESRI